MQPHLEGWRELGFEVVFVTASDAKTMNSFIADRKVTMDVLLDRDLSFHRSYRVGGIPHSFVVDKDGILQDAKVGWGTGGIEWLQGWVSKLRTK